MHNITLIFTHHSELGNHTAQALCNVIHSINPDVIFEELPEEYQVIAYNCKASFGVEVDAIKMYLQHKTIAHIPVDTYGDLTASYFDTINDLNKGVASLGEFDQSKVRKLVIRKHKNLISQHGLSFLNSDENEELIRQEQRLQDEIVELSNDDILKQLNRKFKEDIHNREYEIIDNVYRYSESNKYEQAILFIGSGHRSTIISVIEQFEAKERLQLNWWLW
ncbi:MAG: hypothetical protein EOO43_00750 [Flavobacterium sp.]|nr:MAG: hypothetical protein EOO43_00750 [Flavobacterium sp.]